LLTIHDIIASKIVTLTWAELKINAKVKAKRNFDDRVKTNSNFFLTRRLGFLVSPERFSFAFTKESS